MRRTATTTRAALAAAVLAAAATGCTAQDEVAAPAVDSVGDDAVGRVALTSGDQRVDAPPVCVADVPDDLGDCVDPPDEVPEIALHPTRKATVAVPRGLVSSGYRLRVNGVPVEGSPDVLEDLSNPFRVPEAVVAEPGPTTVTVEALRGYGHPKAVWQFRLLDPV
jgi:hypothetical protein